MNHAKELIRHKISLEDTKIEAEKVFRILHKQLGYPGDSPATFGDKSKPPETEQEQLDFLMEFLKYRHGNLKDLYLVIQKRIGELSTSDSQNKSIWDKIDIGYLRAAKDHTDSIKKRKDMLEDTKIDAEKASRIFHKQLGYPGDSPATFGDKSKPPETEQEQLNFLMEYLKDSRSSSLKDLYLVIQKQIGEPSTSDSQRGFGSNEIGTRASGQESKIPGNISGTGAESSNRAVEQPHDDAAHRGEAFPKVKRRKRIKRKPKVEEASPSDTLVEDENKRNVWEQIGESLLKTTKVFIDSKLSNTDLQGEAREKGKEASGIIDEQLRRPKGIQSDPPRADEENLTILKGYLNAGGYLETGGEPLQQMHSLIEKAINKDSTSN